MSRKLTENLKRRMVAMSILDHDYHSLGPEVQAFLKQRHTHLIDGREQAIGDAVIEVVDPSNGRAIAAISAGGSDAVDAAVTAAHKAFTGIWRRTAPRAREAALLRLADLVDQHAEILAKLETVDNGMPFWLSRNMVLPGASGVLRYMAGWPTKIAGQTLSVGAPMPDAEFFGYTLREPVGVVGAIIPWNMPLMMAIWKIAPAIAAGCTIVIKPAEDASLSALYLGKLAREAGLPNGVINIVTGRGDEAGEALVRHPLVNKISFTGSTRVGKHINRLATETLKKVTLELGGKSPTIIFDDADLDAAVEGAAESIFLNSGQICVAGSRLYVQQRVYDEVLERLAEHADRLKVGAGFNEGSRMGPLINARQQSHVESCVARSIDQGARVLNRRTSIQSNGGFYVAPHVLAVPNQENCVVHEEVFGPVLAVLPFDHEEQLVGLSNDSVYGLAASIWSRDVGTVHRVVGELKCGKVSVNTAGFPYPGLPEGGRKQSGFGRDLGQEGLDGYLESKSVLMRKR